MAISKYFPKKCRSHPKFEFFNFFSCFIYIKRDHLNATFFKIPDFKKIDTPNHTMSSSRRASTGSTASRRWLNNFGQGGWDPKQGTSQEVPQLLKGGG